MPSLICRGGASPRLCSVSTPPFSPVVFPPASTWSVLSLHAATAVLRMGWRGGGGGGGRTSCTELKPPTINGIARPRPFVCCCVHRPTAVPPHPRSPSQPRRAVGAGSGDANDANGQSCDGAPRSGGNGPPWSYDDTAVPQRRQRQRLCHRRPSITASAATLSVGRHFSPRPSPPSPPSALAAPT